MWLSLRVSWSKLGVADTDHSSEIEGRNVPAIFYLSQAPLFPSISWPHVSASMLCFISLIQQVAVSIYFVLAWLYQQGYKARLDRVLWLLQSNISSEQTLFNKSFRAFQSHALSSLDPKLTTHAILESTGEFWRIISKRQEKKGFHELTGRLTAYRFREYSGMYRKQPFMKLGVWQTLLQMYIV